MISLAQFSDSHLYADINAQHYGANVYQNLVAVLTAIQADVEIELAIFSGDLSQDHSLASYQNFVAATKLAQLTKPLYFVAGNHDDINLLNNTLKGGIFCQTKTINLPFWQIQLLTSKTHSPAGKVNLAQLAQLASSFSTPNQLFVMHHHPLNTGYFIDKHGLQNQTEFWQWCQVQNQSKHKIRTILCGHVHNDLSWYHQPSNIQVYACPATSIQFQPTVSGIKAKPLGAGFRKVTLLANGAVNAEVCWLAK